ncbi:MAG: S8 family serine peptidase, partial [Treponema sp.]|nr:S8 family serine peptidase [Treponema sp.]
MFGRPYTGDVALDTVGSPGSYGSFFTVASVENDGGIGLVFQVDNRFFGYQDGSNGSNSSLAKLDVSDDLSGTTYEYVFVDGLGDAADYEGMDLNGKVVFCSRGVTNFSLKAQTAVNLGAAATIVYNNQAGLFGMDLSGYSYTNPCASISQADAIAIREASTAQTTSAGVTYYTGEITIIGREVGYLANSDYYTMSQFSSWGVPGDLSLKPEITAPGGNIYSLFGQTPSYGGGPDQYELMSGTSMAAPAITGMAALMAQYIRES